MKNTMQKRLLAGAIVFAVFFVFTLTTAHAEEATTTSGMKVQTSFSDVPRTSPQYTAIMYLNQEGVLAGYSEGTFKPENPINRAEVLKIILGGSNIEIPATATDSPFVDVPKTEWFARFVEKAKALGIVKGNDADGTFAPGRQVNKAEFLKMLFQASSIKIDGEALKAVSIPDVAADAWYAAYLKYASQIGIIQKTAEGKLLPEQAMTRGEVAGSLYLLTLIRKGTDTQFLLSRAEAELAQIEVYVAANRVDLSKRASELAVDLTQQALKNLPDNNVVLGAAKLARAYDYLVDSFVLGIQKKFTEAAEKANLAIDKAGEAWEANNATQPIAKHIKERAREILTQVGGTEQ